MSSQNDGDLVKRTLQGQTDAFVDLVMKYQDSVYNLAYQKILNAAEAEDTAQEAFLRAYRQLRKLKKPESFGGWLYAIAVNVCRERGRARRIELPLESIMEPQAPAEDHRRDELLSLVGELPDKYRLPLVLHFVDGLAYREIGELLGIREASVRSRVHRAKAMLRKRAAEEEI